jgi:hypothetical protein
MTSMAMARRDTTTATMATGDNDNDNDVDGDSATGNEVGDDGDGATGDDNDDDKNGDDGLPLRCYCQCPALQSCAAAALRRQHSAPPLRCSCHAAAANALRCRAALQQCAADLRRHHCTPTLRCSCQCLALPPLRCSCQCPVLPLTCEENTPLRGCAAAANALCYRRCAAAALQLPRCRCQRIALPSCADAALRGHHCAPPAAPCTTATALPVDDRSTITTRTKTTSAADPCRCSVLPPSFSSNLKKSGGDISYHDLEIRWKVPEDFPGGRTKPRCADHIIIGKLSKSS